MKKSILSTKSQLVNLFLGVGTVLVSIAAANPAQANVPCSNLGVTQIGDKCYVDVPIYLRVENRRDPANFLDRYEPNPGFLITGHTINVRSRVGDTTGPHTIQKQSGSITVTEEQIKTAEKHQTAEFAAPFTTQMAQVQYRVFQQYWRTPAYIYAKASLCTFAALFIGFSFFKAQLSQQGLTNQMISFSIVKQFLESF